jgi:hypothetical protein
MLRIGELHFGDCDGSDKEAFALAKEQKARTVAHPPDVDKLRAFCEADEIREPYPYLVRDGHIVDEVEALVATPAKQYEERRSGTWATVRRARRAKKPVFIVWPDGSLLQR